MDRLRAWLLAIVFRARMGATEAALLIVTFGAIFLATLPLQPKPEESGLLHVLWAAVMVGSGLLIARGVVALVLIVLRPLLERAGVALARLPIEFRSPIVRRPSEAPGEAAAAPGFLDFEAVAVKEMERMTKTLGLINKETVSIGNVMGRYTPRFVQATTWSASAKQALGREAGSKMDNHVRRMDGHEVSLRAGIEPMTTNYLERIRYADADAVAELRPTIVGMREGAAEARPSISGMRDATITLRRQNVQQSINQAMDRLDDVLGRLISDFDAVTRFTTDALQIIDDKVDEARVAAALAAAEAEAAAAAPATPAAPRKKRKPAAPRS